METYTMTYTYAEIADGKWGLNLRIYQSSDGAEVAKKLAIYDTETGLLVYVDGIKLQLESNPNQIPTL
jgi:hypothetical protein